MDIKNRPDKYAATIGLPSFDLTGIRESISLLTEGPADYEFRTTVVREFHEAEDFEEIVKTWKSGEITTAEAARQCRFSRSTLYNKAAELARAANQEKRDPGQ